MKSCVNRCCVAGILAVMLFLPGCKKAGSNANSTSGNEAQPSGGGVSLQPPAPGGAVQNVRNAVRRTVEINDLKQLALIYLSYIDEHNAAPMKLEDLNLQREAPKLLPQVKDGEIVVIWNLNPRQAINGTSNTVLAYDKDVPTKGGPVALLDGSVQRMTKEEFEKKIGKPAK